MLVLPSGQQGFIQLLSSTGKFSVAVKHVSGGWEEETWEETGHLRKCKFIRAWGLFLPLLFLSSSSFLSLPHKNVLFQHPYETGHVLYPCSHVLPLSSPPPPLPRNHPPSLLDFDWIGFPNLQGVELHGEICLGLVSTGRKGVVQGWAGLGRWRTVLLLRTVGWDSRKLWGKTTSRHQSPRSSSGALPLAATAAEEHRSTKQRSG